MYGKEETGLIQWKWIGPFFYGGDGGEVRAVRPSGERGTVVWGWFPETGGMNEWEAALMRGFSTVHCPGWMAEREWSL